MDRITPEQQQAMKQQLIRYYLESFDKASIAELSSRQQSNFLRDFGVQTIVIQEVNNSIQ